MEGTIKLFYEDSHIREFEAKVLSCQPEGDYYKVVLDRTAFFPEGGGQYGDVGYLDDVKVTDTREKEGVIYHKTDIPFEEGQTVCGKLDWSVRFERMQQHSGEHIVSGIVHRRYGYENVGFHLGDECCTMDFNGPISKDELKEIEKEANKAVFENLDIFVTYPTKNELAEMEYRSKIEIDGQVRIVTIPGYDVCACCAPHVKQTGEIGLIKLVNIMNYKGGERITMLCGSRALEDYDIKQENARAIGAMLCEKENEIASAVERLKTEQGSLKSKVAQLQQKLLSYKAEEIELQEHITCVFDEELTGNGPREFMNLLLERGAKVCAVFAGTDKLGYRYVIGSRTEDVRPLSKMLNEKFQGRGGGKPQMVQGSLCGEKSLIIEALQ